MAEELNNKCAHPACSCMTADGESKYCSQYCEDAGETTELSCNCGHAGCALEAAWETGALGAMS